MIAEWLLAVSLGWAVGRAAYDTLEGGTPSAISLTTIAAACIGLLLLR